MFSYFAQIHVEHIQQSCGKDLVEELGNIGIQSVQAHLLIVQNHDLLAKSVQEVQSSLIQRTSATSAHHHDEGNILIGDLKRAMEILAGMDCRRMNPLHFLQQADRIRISNTEVRARTHNIDEFLFAVFFCPSFCSRCKFLFGSRNDLVVFLIRSHESIVMSITLDLIQNFNSQPQSFCMTIVIRFFGSTIGYDMIAIFRQRALSVISNSDRSSASFLSDASSANCFRSRTRERLSDNDRIFAQCFRGRMAELVRRVMANNCLLYTSDAADD